jgi:hypothetical protein
MNNDFDLTQFDDDYANAEIKESEFDDVPDGKYIVNIDRVELTKSKKGNDMLKWSLCIQSGQYEGRLLWKYNMIATAENVAWLKRDLQSCGLILEKLSDLPANLVKLLDVKMELSKKQKGEFSNLYFGKIAGHTGFEDKAIQDNDDIPF